MKKIILLVLFFLFLNPVKVSAANIDNPKINQQPVIKWGNTSYHDSLGARDPWIIKDNGTYYLYYDGIEDLLNPSFESNLGTNGWDTYEAQISTSTEEHLFGQQSLKILTNDKTTVGSLAYGAFTGNYYYQNTREDTHRAVPTGLEVTPNTNYIASVYVKAPVYASVGLVVIEYTDDPGYWTNHIEPVTNRVTVWGTDDWQRLSVKFTTLPNTKAITISFVANGNTTTYWDGVQLERVFDNRTTPTDFPVNINFNKPLEDILGWRPCLATSTDGVNFTKRGSVEITGAKEAWQNLYQPGWSVADAMFLNVFPYETKWYAHTWTSGYEIKPGNPLVNDQGIPNVRRFGYGDWRAFLPNGNPRSALLVSDSLTGPFQRTSSGPALIPDESIKSCSALLRPEAVPWGCEDLAVNGVPHLINNQWALFLNGQTWYQNGINSGYKGNLCIGIGCTCGLHGITTAMAIGSTPLGPWTLTNFSPLFSAADICANNLVPEGPVYYFDRASQNHIIFVNQLQDMSITAFWTKDPFQKWPGANRKIILDSANVPNSTALNLPTILEDQGKLKVYFGYREQHSNNGAAVNNYLFHDIGLATFDLPLFGSDILSSRSLLQNFTSIFDYNNLVGNYGH